MKKTIAALLALVVAVPYGAFGATTNAGNVYRMTADADTIPADGSVSPPFIQIQTTPTTTGTVVRLREASVTGKVVWETTFTETRPITSTGVVVTAVGGLEKIVENVVIRNPTGGLYLEVAGTTPIGWTGIYLYRREGNQ